MFIIQTHLEHDGWTRPCTLRLPNRAVIRWLVQLLCPPELSSFSSLDIPHLQKFLRNEHKPQNGAKSIKLLTDSLWFFVMLYVHCVLYLWCIFIININVCHLPKQIIFISERCFQIILKLSRNKNQERIRWPFLTLYGFYDCKIVSVLNGKQVLFYALQILKISTTNLDQPFFYNVCSAIPV